MDKRNLVEIKKDEVGTGLLIEHDGYISPTYGNNKNIMERIHSGDSTDDFKCPFPFVVDAVLQRYGSKNANGRIYPEDILKREVQRYQIKINEVFINICFCFCFPICCIF